MIISGSKNKAEPSQQLPFYIQFIPKYNQIIPIVYRFSTHAA